MADIVKAELKKGVDVDTPIAGPDEVINTAWATILEVLTTAVRDLSTKKHGHSAGNLTTQDIQNHLIYKCGIQSQVASSLAREGYRSHEQYRWSDEGVEAQKAASK